MKNLLIPLVVIIIIVGALGLSYNNMVTLRENVDAQWSQVETVMKRRADLIPNLVNTVKGYASHESEVLTGITEARSRIQAASTPEEYAEANNEFNNALRNLYVVVESYPDLKANQNFSELQAQLEGTENRISTERTRYNDRVREYNTKIARFPTNIIAGIFNFDKKAYFEISKEDAKTPEVNF